MNELSKIIDHFSLVRQIPIFSKLNWLELHTVASNCVLLEYKKGDVIYKEGDPPDAFYCLVSGRLLAYTLKENGERDCVEYIYRGMHFGIISLLTGERHSLTFEALNDSVVLKIDKENFLKIFKQIPRLSMAVSRSLSRRIKKKESGAKLIFESTIISVYSSISQSGSSTYAFNLALSLQRETGKKAIFVNIVSASCEARSYQRIHSASPQWKAEATPLKEIADNHRKIFQNIFHEALAIDLLNVSVDPEDTSLDSHISRFVSLLASEYHFVVVDLPNHFDEGVIATLTQSDSVHIISPDSDSDLQLTRTMLCRLKETLKENFSKETVHVMIAGTHTRDYESYEEFNKVLGHDVYTILPTIRQEELKDTIDSSVMTVKIPSSDSDYARSIRKIARETGGVLVGLILGSGAALGFAHIGVLKVLEEEKIPIDIVIGSSIGAAIGGLWLTGRSADEIGACAREFRTRLLSLKLLDVVISKAGFIGGRSIKRWLKRKIGNKTFYNTAISFKVVAYDLIGREELIIDEGRLVDAIMKSVAIPGVVKPIASGGRLMIDGGIVNPLPTNALARLGVKKIIAVNVFQSPDDVCRTRDIFQARLQKERCASFRESPVTYIGVRLRGLMRKIFCPNIADLIIRSLQAMEYVIAEQSAKQSDILIHPDVAGIDWFEFYRVDDLIGRGQEATRNQLSAIKALVAEK